MSGPLAPRQARRRVALVRCEGPLIAALPFDFWLRVKFAPRSDLVSDIPLSRLLPPHPWRAGW
jgi:hypothetical protein